MTLTKAKPFITLLIAVLPSAQAAGSGSAPSPYRRLIVGSRQALVVTANGWNSVNGTLRYFERKSGVWIQTGQNTPVVVGKNGLAWDGKTVAHEVTPEFVKQEGDGRSPAGVFRLNPQFGFASSPPGEKMRYVALTDQSECVDDVNSKFYNEVVTRNQVSRPDWSSSEKMRSIDQYKLGVVVRYNPQNVKSLGSCIFLHVWRGPDRGTAGCTAMDETTLQQIMGTLDEKKKPILIQLPESTYETLRGAWQLP